MPPDPDPADLRVWFEAGFTADETALWQKWGITLADAQAWRDSGVANGLRAAQWRVAGVTPDTVGRWRSAGIDATEAVRCHEMGYDLRAARELKRRGLTAEQAYEQGLRTSGGPGPGALRGPTHPTEPAYVRFQKAGVQPQIIGEYMMANWIDDEALRWAAHQIPATDARMWRELKVRPAEAGRLARKGRTPLDVISEWWRAGVP